MLSPSSIPSFIFPRNLLTFYLAPSKVTIDAIPLVTSSLRSSTQVVPNRVVFAP